MFTPGNTYVATSSQAQDQFMSWEMVTADVVIVAADQMARTRYGQEDLLMQRIGGGEQRHWERRPAG